MAKFGKRRVGGALITVATLAVSDRSGYARSSEPVTLSVPLSRFDRILTTNTLVMTASGLRIPAQFLVLSRWGTVADTTAPIRVVQVTFRATVNASSTDSTTYVLKRNGSGTDGGGIIIDTQTNYYEIATGLVTTAGAGRFRIRKTGGGGHNVLESGEVSTGSAWKTVLATGNASALYLKGVTTSEDQTFVTGSVNSPSISGINGETLIVSVNGGANNTVTFLTYTTLWEVIVRINATATGWQARLDSARDSLEIFATNTAHTLQVKNGTSNTRLGFTNLQDGAKRANSQGSDYLSSDYTSGEYVVSLEKQGPERVVVLVTGAFGATAFQAMNDEKGDTGVGAGDVQGSVTASPMLYEARYTFYRDSAYVGIDVLYKVKTGSTYLLCRDAAIDQGGVRFVPNFSGTSTKLAIYDGSDGAGNFASETTSGAGVKYVYQNMAPSGTSNVFSLSQSGFTFTGSPTTLDEGWLIAADSADDRGLVVMQQEVKYKAPHGFRSLASGAGFEATLWPGERGHLDGTYAGGQTYHIFMGQTQYRWRGGVWLFSGAYNITTVRSAWSRYCRSPIIGHAGTAYNTSQAFGMLPPSSVTRSGQTDWNTAATRRASWTAAMVDTSASTNSRSYDTDANDRANNTYTCAGWTRYGAIPGRSSTGCVGNRYDTALRLLHGWMVYGTPALWEWFERVADHACFMDTRHGPDIGQTGAQTPGHQSDETGFGDAVLHTKVPNFIQLEVQFNVYKPLSYLATGYVPFKDAATNLVTNKRGGMYDSTIDLTNNSATYYGQFARFYTWGIEDFLAIWLMEGSSIPLQYARNLAINVLCYSDDTATLDASTIEASGGLGFMPVRANANGTSDQALWTTYTYSAYLIEAIRLAHEWGSISRELGYTAFSVADLMRLARMLKAVTRYHLTGADGLTTNSGSTATLRSAATAPLIRGHNKTGGNNTLYGSNYEWRWATTDSGTDSTRSTDTGLAAAATGTATFTGGSPTVTLSASRNSLVDSYLYADADGASTAIRVSAHTVNTTTVTLASNYGGSNGSKAYTASPGASGGSSIVHEGWAQAIDSFAYTSKLYRADGDTARADATLTAVRNLFENLHLYAFAASFTMWDQTFADSTRGSIITGTTSFSDDRGHGWMTRRGSHWYLAYEAAGAA